MKALMLDQRSRTLTDAQTAARQAAVEIADPNVRVTSDGRFVKETKTNRVWSMPNMLLEIMQSAEDIID